MIAKPWTLKLEMTRGCNLSCTFCPIHVLPEYSADKKFLTPKDCEIAVKSYSQFKPDGRIELTMRGEPTLNPHILENLRIIKKYLPKTQVSMFTNGVLFFKNKALISELLEAGVNILNIDCYNNTYDRFEKMVADLPYRKEDFREFSAYKRHSMGYKFQVINLVPDIKDPEELVKVRKLHNNAGNVDPKLAPPLESPLQKKCARPFREYVVCYNLDVVICCHDWKAECVLGNLKSKSAKQIWYGKLHHEILKSLYNKDRSGVPCNKCDYAGGYRLGFLKNPEEE